MTTYKVEWDTSPAFTGGVGGAVLGSYQKVLPQPAGACGSVPCDYVVSGLAKGTPYYVRVFAYNRLGFSADPTPTEPPFDAPCTYARPPAAVAVNPGPSASQLVVRFPPSPDDGGCPVAAYKLEWDAAGALGYAAGAQPASSLLFAPREVQVLTVAARRNDLGGAFRVALDDAEATDPVRAGAPAAEVQAALAALPSVGGVKVRGEGGGASSSGV